jgi:type IV secretory pathway VirB2 component (pilin)
MKMLMKNHDHSPNMKNTNHYRRFAVMLGVSFVVMYILMYAMVATFKEALPNINQFYMAGLMTAAMAIIELLVMGFMYTRKKLNLALIGVAVVALVFCFVGIRQQLAVGDAEFLRSMIPHHSGAILMCENADLKDLEIKELCERIIVDQQVEIDWMQNKLDQQ